MSLTSSKEPFQMRSQSHLATNSNMHYVKSPEPKSNHKNAVYYRQRSEIDRTTLKNEPKMYLPLIDASKVSQASKRSALHKTEDQR